MRINEEKVLHIAINDPDDEVGEEIDILEESDAPFRKVPQDKDLLSCEGVGMVFDVRFEVEDEFPFTGVEAFWMNLDF